MNHIPRFEWSGTEIKVQQARQSPAEKCSSASNDGSYQHTQVNPRHVEHGTTWTPSSSDQRSSQTYGNSF